MDYIQRRNTFVTIPLPTSTLLISISHSILRLTIQPHSTDDVIFISDKLHADNFPQELQLVFGNVESLFEKLEAIGKKNSYEKVGFNNGVVYIRVMIDERSREIPIKMKKMVRENHRSASTPSNQFLITSVPSESAVQTGISSKLDNSRARNRFMTLPTKKNLIRQIIMEDQTNKSQVTQFSKDYGGLINQGNRQAIILNSNKKGIAYGRYEVSNKSKTEGVLRSLNKKSLDLGKFKRKGYQNQLDLSNKELKLPQIKQLISYEWMNITLLNLGYNSIGNEGARLVTTIKWPSLKTLYLCFNNISRLEWIPSNIKFIRTLSLSGNQLKQLPKSIGEFEFIEELFIYGNKLEVLPDELAMLASLKNLSIYSNKLEPQRNKRLLSKLKGNKVHIWD